MRVPASPTHSWLFDSRKPCAVERSSRQPRESSWNAKASMRMMPSPTFCVSRSKVGSPSSIGPNRSRSRLGSHTSDLSIKHMTEHALDELDTFRQEAGLSLGELWLRYFELGGMSTGLQLEAFLYGVLLPSTHDHDVIAHAINERFVELGGNHPVAYSKDHKSDS